jgi:hypothetical protein
MFIWTSLAHVALPLGQIGISRIPGEGPVLATLHQSIGEQPGLYYFPWTNMKDSNAMAEESARMKTNPSGILIYRPPGASAMETGTLVAEFAKEVIVALLAAYLLSKTVLSGYWARAGFVAVIGVIATLTTNLSYWIWYSFPANYTLAAITTDTVGYAAAGLAIAAVMRRKTGYRPMRAATA